jgi:predicted MFS family arabinose efflux permease
MFAFVLIQLLLNTATGPFQAIIPDRVPREHQGKASGWMGVWQLIGQIIGLILPGLLLTPMIVNLLLKSLGKPPLLDTAAISLGTLLICAVSAAVLLVCLFFNAPLLIQKPLPRQNAKPISEALRDALDLGLKNYPDFAWLLASRAIINLGIYAAINFLRYYVSDELRPPFPTALAVMFIALAVTLGGVVSTLVAGKLADKVSKRVVIYYSCGFAALAALGFCLAHNFYLACAIGLVFGIGYGAFCAVDWAFAANLMPQGREGKYMAIFHIAFTAPQVLGLMLGGFIGTQFGYRAVFLSVPVYLIIGAALVSKVRERHEIEAAEST